MKNQGRSFPQRLRRTSASRTLPSSFHRSRSLITRARRFERRRCRWESCRECPIFMRLWLAQLAEASRSERAGWGCKSFMRHHFAHVVQCRDSGLKTRTVSVQIRPWAPTACSPMSRGIRSNREGCRCNSCHADHLGMSTGQANRASVLTSACLRASGASPRHSAILRA